MLMCWWQVAHLLEIITIGHYGSSDFNYVNYAAAYTVGFYYFNDAAYIVGFYYFNDAVAAYIVGFDYKR